MTKAKAMKKSKAAPKKAQSSSAPRAQVRAKEAPDWRSETLNRVRALIAEAVPEAVETRKWRGVPVWERDGIICTGETYKDKVKLTFARGAVLKDPARLFNSSLDGNVRRAIDIHENEPINEKALKALVRAAAAVNTERARPARKKPKNV